MNKPRQRVTCVLCGEPLPPHKYRYCSEKCANWRNPHFAENALPKTLSDMERNHGEAFDMAKALDTLHRIAPPLRPTIRGEYGATSKEILLPPAYGYHKFLPSVEAAIEQRQRAYAVLDEVLARAKHRRLLALEQVS